MAKERHLKIILVMVASLDGRTTSGESTRLHEWTSKEDQEYFSSLIKKSELILMGRKTYEGAKRFMNHADGRLRVVFTKKPEEYAKDTNPNQLEFTSESPEKVIEQLEKRGFSKALLVGGASLNTEFLKADAIDELWLTIEPVVLGEGNPLFAGETTQQKLQFISLEKLNEKGTVLIKYLLQKEK